VVVASRPKGLRGREISPTRNQLPESQSFISSVEGGRRGRRSVVAWLRVLPGESGRRGVPGVR